MRRFRTAIALVIAFILAYVATPRENVELQAQVGLPCKCTFHPSSMGLGPNAFACLGTADMSTLTCTTLLTQCFSSGWAKWTADPASCAYNLNTAGWIAAVASGQGGPSYFNPTITNTVPGIPWGVVSANCAAANVFGAVMQVAHDSWTGSCACLSGTPTLTNVGIAMWTCGL